MKRALIPPQRRPEDAPPPPAELYVEPEEDMLILGEMLHDADTMSQMLRELPFDRHNYRGNLRVVRGAAVRMADRCARLLDEVANPKVNPHFQVFDTSQLAQREAATEAMAGPGETVYATPHPKPENVTYPPADSQPRNGTDHRKNTGRKRSTAVPIEGGLKAAIVRELREGPKTSTELIETLTKDSGVRPDAIHETLAKMRVAKEVTHQHMGRRIINRLA